MKKHLFPLLLLSMISLSSFAQKETINDYSNKLLCNAYAYEKADTATFNFLQNHFSYLTRPKPEDGYLTPPEGTSSTHSITTMSFKKHPFFDFKLKEGRIEFFTVDGMFEKGAQLWLVFNNDGDEDYAISQIANSLGNLSYQKNITTKGTQETILYTAYVNGVVYKPELVITKDDINNTYTILFKRSVDEGL